MAEEISSTIGLTVTKSNLKLSKPTATKKITLTGDEYHDTTQDVGTTYEALSVGDLDNAGVAQFTNLDATNFVEIGVEVAAAFYGVIKVMPGETWQVRLSSLTLFARANTAAVKLGVTILEN